MGCNVSTYVRNDNLNQCLEKEQIEVVRTTWEVLKQDMIGTGVFILSKLLENEPQLRPLFLRLSSDPRQFQADEQRLRRHASMVMEALGAAVECLEDSATLVPILRALGQTHTKYKVKADMLPKLWPAIDTGLRFRLGDDYNSKVRSSWHTVFFFLISKMKEGMRKPKLKDFSVEM